ncbi:LacI family DNA-binding transcriptional regulator [Jiella marina]|uniref:LacI family DNA-binding transcriptional regulator n=1 Tax=Jiella sp. LLJ827 TaxID=2917712 RepID=UPI0021016C70|nr:LacI family DNA-binding transcriptional regulator [Jiella sp. LLJ827]MCQ0987134.1 LacI family transcriptional regulator [Jiella sp. LLJ827]
MTSPGERKRVTILDVAREAGVSKSSVSLVLRGSPLVSDDTRERVRTAAKSLGYIYHRGAASLRMAKSRFVALVIPDLTNPFFAQLAVAAEAALFEKDYVPLLANTGDERDRQFRVLRTMREYGVAGVMMSPAHGTSHADIAGLGIPAVGVMRRLTDGLSAELPYIGPDNEAGFRALTRYLIDNGHRRFAFLGGYPTMSTQRERLAGFHAALDEAGLDPAEAATIHEGLPSRSGGRAAANEALAARRASAFVAYNDVVAFGANRLLVEAGLKVGRDIALTGFDDVAEASHNAPPLTTVDVRIADLGRLAAETLVARIEGAETAAETIVPVELKIRESSGWAGSGRSSGDCAPSFADKERHTQEHHPGLEPKSMPQR